MEAESITNKHNVWTEMGECGSDGGKILVRCEVLIEVCVCVCELSTQTMLLSFSFVGKGGH